MATACSAGDEAATPMSLTWPPPVLDDAEVVHVTDDDSDLRLDEDRDYRVVMPAEPLTAERGLSISGGRNVVLVGGEITFPEDTDWPTRRALYLKDQRGVIHVEGLRLTGALTEGINLSQSYRATVQLQNIHVDTVEGTRDTHHADCLQVWAGPAQLRVDGFTGSTNYQGFFLLPNQHYDGDPPEAFDLRRVRLAATKGYGYMLWIADESPWLSVDDVELRLPGARDRKRFLKPEDTWRQVSVVEDFTTATMPSGRPGLGYRSPGYARQE